MTVVIQYRRVAYVALAATLLAASAHTSANAGVQGCVTDCQTSHTDCILACDGDPQCASGCQQQVDECLATCRNPKPQPPPAKGEGGAAEGGSGPTGGTASGKGG